MDMWMKVGSAVLLGIMLLVLAPQAKHMLQHSPDAKPGDWTGFIVPLLVVGGFVAVLMWAI